VNFERKGEVEREEGRVKTSMRRKVTSKQEKIKVKENHGGKRPKGKPSWGASPKNNAVKESMGGC